MKEREIIKLNRSIQDSLSECNLSNGKMKNTIANYILAVCLLKNIFEEMKLQLEGYSLECSKATEDECSSYMKEEVGLSPYKNSVVENTLETLNQMAEEGYLRKFVDYDATRKVDDEPCLRLNYTAFYESFKGYCRDNNISHEVLTLKAFKKELMKRDYCLYCSKPVSFRYGEDTKGFKTFRAAVLSIEKLKARKLRVDFLINGQG
jgi:hypothetical protein